MCNRRLRRGLILLALVCAVLFTGVALADKEDALEMQTYWSIVGASNQNEPLARAMSGDYAALTLEELKAVTKDDLLAFAAAYKLPVSMARHAWYMALADTLTAEVPATATGERLPQKRACLQDSFAGCCWTMNGMSPNGTMATTGRRAARAGTSPIGWRRKTFARSTARTLLSPMMTWSGCSASTATTSTTDTKKSCP